MMGQEALGEYRWRVRLGDRTCVGRTFLSDLPAAGAFKLGTKCSELHGHTRRLLPSEQALALQLSEPDTCRGRSENVSVRPQLARAILGLPNRMSFPGHFLRSGNRVPAPRLSWKRESSFACQRQQPAPDASRRHPARGWAKIWNPKSGRFRPSYSAGLRKASQRQPPAATHGKTGGLRQAHVQHRQEQIE